MFFQYKVLAGDHKVWGGERGFSSCLWLHWLSSSAAGIQGPNPELPAQLHHTSWEQKMATLSTSCVPFRGLCVSLMIPSSQTKHHSHRSPPQSPVLWSYHLFFIEPPILEAVTVIQLLISETCPKVSLTSFILPTPF